MIVLESLRAYLLTFNIPTYISFLPPQSGITLTLAMGYPPEPQLPYSTIRVQVRSRAQDYLTAQTQAYAVFDKLHGTHGMVEGTDIVDCLAETDPYDMGYDQDNTSNFVQTYTIQIVNPTLQRV